MQRIGAPTPVSAGQWSWRTIRERCQALGGFGVEAFLAGEQHSADPVERVITPLAVAFVRAVPVVGSRRAPGGQLHAVEGIHNLIGARQHLRVDRGICRRPIQRAAADAIGASAGSFPSPDAGQPADGA